MAVFNSTQIANQLAIPPVYDDAVNWYGKYRVLRFNYTQAALGTIADSVRLVKLPAGKVNVYSLLSFIANSAGGAGMLTNVGAEAYRDKLGNVVAANLIQLASALDIAAAGRRAFALPAAPSDGIVQYESMNGVILTATTSVVAPPAGLQLNGFIVCSVE